MEKNLENDIESGLLRHGEKECVMYQGDQYLVSKELGTHCHVG